MCNRMLPGDTPVQKTHKKRIPAACDGATLLTDVAKMHELLDKVWQRDEYDMFKKPVSEAEAPGYFRVITDPMDLSTIKAKAEDNQYTYWEELATDLYLMYNNGMKYNPQGSTYWKASKAQQMHARSLLENARAGKPLVSAKAKAANQARKETMAANKAAREKQQAMNKKARAEQRAAQEAKILRRAGISDGSTLDARTTFRRQPDAGLYQYKGLAACKTGDNTYVGLFGPSFDRETQPQTFEYGSSLRNFAASLSSRAYSRVKCHLEAMVPASWRPEFVKSIQAHFEGSNK